MELKQRKQAAILGALVADAASLGFHWLYDPARIEELGGETPEFRKPCAQDYEGSSGYFAADDKVVGDLSHYGAQLMVALESLDACGGHWNPYHYQSAFCTTFDRGGKFRGYIDGATTGTLNRVKELNTELLEAALSQAQDLTDSQRSFFKKYVPKKGVIHTGSEFEESIAGMADLVYKDEGIADKARAIVRYYDNHRTARSGADDNQLPAVSKLPVVVAHFTGSDEFSARVEEAIRVTNDNEQAVIYGLYAARVLEAVLTGEEVATALKGALAHVSDETAKQKLESALVYDTSDLAALGRNFGPACPLPSAIPVGVALLKEGKDFATTVRENILVSGDNAGRAVWLGAILAARHGLGGEWGVPTEWLAKLRGLKDVLPMLSCV